jgi:hypothetical protein
MRTLLVTITAASLLLGGCARWRQQDLPPLENPLTIPATQCDVVWDQIVDVVDNYFDIQTEQRVRQAGEIMTVGRIDTAPKTGSTFLEPWRGDGADQYEKAHNTLQTIRRRAVVQVVPAPDVFQIEVTVFKELEDLARPEYSTAGAATFRNDGSLIRIEEPVGVQPTTDGWIPLGRDAALEQRILQEIWIRLAPPGARPTSRGFGALPSEWFGGGEVVAPGNGPVTTTPGQLMPQAEVLPAPAQNRQ